MLQSKRTLQLSTSDDIVTRSFRCPKLVYLSFFILLIGSRFFTSDGQHKVHLHHHYGATSGSYPIAGQIGVQVPQVVSAAVSIEFSMLQFMSFLLQPKQRLIHVIKIKKRDGTFETKIFTGRDAAVSRIVSA